MPPGGGGGGEESPGGGGHRHRGARHRAGQGGHFGHGGEGPSPACLQVGLLEEQYGEAGMEVMARIKRCLDPRYHVT